MAHNGYHRPARLEGSGVVVDLFHLKDLYLGRSGRYFHAELFAHQSGGIKINLLVNPGHNPQSDQSLDYLSRRHLYRLGKLFYRNAAGDLYRLNVGGGLRRTGSFPARSPSWRALRTPLRLRRRRSSLPFFFWEFFHRLLVRTRRRLLPYSAFTWRNRPFLLGLHPRGRFTRGNGGFRLFATGRPRRFLTGGNGSLLSFGEHSRLLLRFCYGSRFFPGGRFLLFLGFFYRSFLPVHHCFRSCFFHRFGFRCSSWLLRNRLLFLRRGGRFCLLLQIRYAWRVLFPRR